MGYFNWKFLIFFRAQKLLVGHTSLVIIGMNIAKRIKRNKEGFGSGIEKSKTGSQRLWSC